MADDSISNKDKRRSTSYHVTSTLQFLDSKFLISDGTNAIEINRKDCSITSGSNFGEVEATSIRIYGIIGIIRLLRGPYLIVITDREDVGKIQGEKIWRVSETKLIPFKEYSNLTDKQQEDEEKYLQMVKLVLAQPSLYFSYTYDITHTFQRKTELSEEELTKPLWERADKRYFWNRYLLEPFIAASSSAEVAAWILPVMMGYINIGTIVFEGQTKLDFALFSRRNVNRPGTRFWVRGIDDDGNVANSVETEQIVITEHGEVSAFVQMRGSIPVYWDQFPDLSWQSKVKIGAQDSMNPFKVHFQDLVSNYGKKQLLVNLAGHHGREGLVVEEYGDHVKKLGNNDIIYIAFDFHKECPGMKWDRVNWLVNEVKSHIDEIGFFAFKDGKVVRKQDGTVRTNCIDNLDRTNVVQSMFARDFLLKQLQSIGVIKQGDSIESHKQFDLYLRGVWADNADYVSWQYAGAGALKTDFTRTGKRTPVGAFNDGVNAVTRYVLNNFYDGFKQDAFNLFLGNYKVKAEAKSPFPNEKDVYRNGVYAVFGGLVFLLFASSVLSPQGSSWGFKFFVATFWGATIAGLKFGAQKYGHLLVNRPILVSPKKKED